MINPVIMYYIQVVSIVMPIFCIGLGIAVGYMVMTLGTSGMGRRAWKANVRAILEELDKEKRQLDVGQGAANEDLKPVSDAIAKDKPTPLPTIINRQPQQPPSSQPTQSQPSSPQPSPPNAFS